MVESYIFGGIGVAAAAALALSGRWRVLLLPARIPARKMTVRRLRLLVSDAADVERIDGILSHFAAGFNTALTAVSDRTWRVFCDSLEPLYQPFAHEGAAMAYLPRHLFRFDPEHFERTIVKPAPGFRYLHYVGLGFWWGMRRTAPARVAESVRPLDVLHRYLCFDGYGFTQAFFHDRRRPDALRRLDAFPGYARNAAYQGAGRALYFLYHSDPEALMTRLEGLGDMAAEAAGGVGLAAAFVNPDRLEKALALAERFPPGWRAHVHLGLCFGLKARSINDVGWFEENVSRLPADVQEAIRASIRECDRVELRVRDAVRGDATITGYRRWRETVAEWMMREISYPLRGLQRAAERRGKTVSGKTEGESARSASSDPVRVVPPAGGERV